MDLPPINLQADRIETGFVGARRRLGRIALTTGLLTLLTLGLYRFWARTRLRRWYWSSIRPGGLPLEYTGNGFEKFTGFLIAVVILAVWLALVNLLTMFASLNFLATPVYGYAVSIGLLVPLWFWARYRARAYMLARTRWRGIRFGMDPRARGYALRACYHWALTILSLGLLWPRMTYRLEAFRTDRTFFGDKHFRQGGRWTALWPGYAPAYLLALAMAGAGYASDPRAGFAFLLLVPLFAVAVAFYRVRSLRLLTSAKSIGGTRLSADIRPGRILRIVLFNGLAILILLTLPIAGLVAAEAMVLPAGTLSDPARLLAMGPLGWAVIGALVLVYFALFLGWGVMRHVLITMPILRHYANGLSLDGAAALGAIRQAGPARAGSADGFAEALDVGAAL